MVSGASVMRSMMMGLVAIAVMMRMPVMLCGIPMSMMMAAGPAVMSAAAMASVIGKDVRHPRRKGNGGSRQEREEGGAAVQD